MNLSENSSDAVYTAIEAMLANLARGGEWELGHLPRRMGDESLLEGGRRGRLLLIDAPQSSPMPADCSSGTGRVEF